MSVEAFEFRHPGKYFSRVDIGGSQNSRLGSDRVNNLCKVAHSAGNLRDELLFSLLREGLTPRQVVRVRRPDIMMSGGNTVVAVKFRTVGRQVPLGEQTATLLKSYLEEGLCGQEAGADFLFRSRSDRNFGGPLSVMAPVDIARLYEAGHNRNGKAAKAGFEEEPSYLWERYVYPLLSTRRMQRAVIPALTEMTGETLDFWHDGSSERIGTKVLPSDLTFDILMPGNRLPNGEWDLSLKMVVRPQQIDDRRIGVQIRYNQHGRLTIVASDGKIAFISRSSGRLTTEVVLKQIQDALTIQ